jgi:hypothetical protein
MIFCNYISALFKFHTEFVNTLITVKFTELRDTTYNGSSVLALMYTFHMVVILCILSQ